MALLLIGGEEQLADLIMGCHLKSALAKLSLIPMLTDDNIPFPGI
jgi:hypothetical protein